MKKMINKEIFKAYDVRGIYPDEINEEMVYLTAKAYAQWLKPKKIALGRDVRTSGKSLFEEAKRGLLEMGVDVVDIGVITSEMLLFAIANYRFDGGISITASHNPGRYNGMKLRRKMGEPISSDSGLFEIRDIVLGGEFNEPEKKGNLEKINITEDYIKKVISFVDVDSIKPMKVVVNPSNGAGGRIVDIVGSKLGLEMIKLNFEENGEFPKGPPNPLLPENQGETSELVKSSGAQLGIAWDGDADRVFFFDENGEFVDPYYMVSILSEIFLKKSPGAKIVYDTSIVWAIRDAIKEHGGIPIENKVGYVFIIERMKKEGAFFAGEHSGHSFYKDYYFCDSGMIPALMMLEYLSKTGKKLSEIANPLREKYPVSGELNFEVEDRQEALSKVEDKYFDGQINHMDGVTVEFTDWRVNVRPSNGEPLVRVNIEAKTKELVDEKVGELTKLIQT